MTQSKGCFFQCGDPCTEEGDVYVSDILKHAPDRWNNFKDQALLWRGLDRFGEVYDTVDWKKGDTGYVMHDKCRMIFMTKRRLEQAKKRKEKQDQAAQAKKEEEAAASSSSLREVDDPQWADYI